MINKRVIKDIQDGMKNLKKEFGIHICPEENNFYRIHFILPGPESTPFEGGLYHGMIRLNDDHPYRPPNIHMITPNGRFVTEKHPIPGSSRGICTNFTSFHPESWTPMMNIESVLKGFISLMCDPYDGGVGGINSTKEQIKKLAKESIPCLLSEPIFKKLFPELYENLSDGSYTNVKLEDLCKTNCKPLPENKKTVGQKSTKNKQKIKSKKSKVAVASDSSNESSDELADKLINKSCVKNSDKISKQKKSKSNK
ncbi:MAG: ubiquitin-conjugating enzyme E2 [Satyrvirus sp.]|uniref:E2 ubiquitin-conjugating enzyme n=1 Tax=Satyrvirus sp. TaxID=2487771 RepID=A0A3G5AFY2_9VIRU|nr:MAG: ubiquitin-conjugating enzyme E2 [Satyrvirus sp.]